MPRAARDDVDPPLRIDWLPDGALGDGLPGRLGLTFLPGKRGRSVRYPGRVYRRDLTADLATMRAAGIETLILLVEDTELQRWGDPRIVERARVAGVAVLRFPIPDGEPPGARTEMDNILAAVRAARGSGSVAVACMGGVGRTGTVAACALVEAGVPPETAISLVRQVRHPMAVEMPSQIAFVRAYGARDDRGTGLA